MRYGTKLEDSIQEISKAYPLIMTDANELVTNNDVNAIYLNPMQELLYNFMARELYCRGARALGKTSAISTRVQLCASTLPRSTGVMLGSSVKQLFARTAPNVIKSFETIGHWKEGVHFFRGHAPKSAGFPEPLTKPRVWENVLHFYNGAVLYLVSMAVTGSTNSMNIGFLIADETKYLPWAKVKEEVIPALRTDPYPGWTRKNPLYLSQYYMSDGGITIRQREWEKEKDKDITHEINDAIMDRIALMKRCQDVDDAHGTRYTQMLLQDEQFMAKLNYLRAHSKVFFNCSSMMNMALLGPEWFEQQRRQLPELVYRLGILGEEVGVDKSLAFYSAFDSTVHGYYPNSHDEEQILHSKYTVKATSRIDIGGCTKRVDYETFDDKELSTTEQNCALDVDVIPGQPLLIAHDFNKNVNTLCVGQFRKMEGVQSLCIVRSMWVVNPRRLEDLMEDFCKHYAIHRSTCKRVILYADATARQGGTYASRHAEEFRFDHIIERTLRQHGWEVHTVSLGTPIQHDVKYEFMNNMFQGKERFNVRINLLTNDFLIASLENARLDRRAGKLHKYKGDEKKTTGAGVSTEEEGIGSNNYSDMSDALDVLVYGVWKYGTSGRANAQFGVQGIPVFMPIIR